MRTIIHNCVNRLVALLAILLLAAPLSAQSNNIIWSGSFETGDILQWHHHERHDLPWIWGIPEYCRPEGYPDVFGGDGSCLSLDSNRVRHGEYSAKFTIKNALNGEEPRDCDNGNCDRRRSQLSAFRTLPEVYNVLPYLSERWISFSVYLPDNWQPTGGGWGPVLFGIKPLTNGDQLSGIANVHLEKDSWEIHHRWSPVVNPSSSDVPWQYQMFYRKDYPVIGGNPRWDDGVADFPNPDVSRQALASVNRGGWTDWVLHIKFDARGSSQGGSGFMRYYKREDDGPWIKVVDIAPRRIERGGLTFDRGIGYNSPPTNNNGGFGIGIGTYMAKSQVWNAPNNLSLNFDNIRIGNQSASLSEMEPNGAPGSAGGSDGTESRPTPPSEIRVTQQ